jgi:hypothetical protein
MVESAPRDLQNYDDDGQSAALLAMPTIGASNNHFWT